MDADIAGAADQLALEKIKTQDYRTSLAKSDAREDQRLQLFAKQVAEATAFVDVTEKTAADLLSSKQELRTSIVRALATNYMKPSTATLDASIEADTILKMKRLKSAVLAIEAFINEA